MKTIKHNLLAVAVLMAAVTGGNHPAVASDTTQVNITGTVKDVSCTYEEIPDVKLPEVAITDFGGSASKESSVSAPLNISFTNCGKDTTSIAVTVSGTDDADGDGTVFKSSGSATNVGVVLYDTDNKKFKTNGASKAVVIPVTNRAASTTYIAKYISTKADVSSGSVATVITLAFTYT